MIRNVTGPPAFRLGIVLDDDPLFSALVTGVQAAARDLGLDPVDVRGPDDEIGLDRVLLIGRPARHLQLLGTPSSVPRTVWTGEPLPVDAVPSSHRSAGTRAGARRPRRQPSRLGRWFRRVPLGGAPARWRAEVLAGRLVRTNLAELRWATDRGADIVVTSHDRAEILAGHGLASRVVPFGYHRAFAGLLTPGDTDGRDVPLASLGATSRHLRRGRMLDRFAADRGGPPLLRLDGVWGDERAAILRRSRVLVDVHRVPGTFIGIRLVLALAAGVAVVTEPMPDARPFETGVTHLEVPADELLDAARGLVADEGRRRGIVASGQALLADRLQLTASVRAIIGRSFPAPDSTLAAGTSGPPR